MKFIETIAAWDGVALERIQDAVVVDSLTPIMRAITSLGDQGLFWIAVGVCLFLFRKTRPTGKVVLFSMLLAFIVCNLLLKNIIDRPRPWELYDTIMRLAPDPGDASFPSGHATNAMAASFAILLKGEKKWPGVCAVILALLICFSRLYLGMHFPTDVICGMLIGMASATICWLIDRSIEDSKTIKKH